MGRSGLSVTSTQEVSQCCGLSYWLCLYVCVRVCVCYIVFMTIISVEESEGAPSPQIENK